jgi:transcriptional regulator with XRE-family HTH domain
MSYMKASMVINNRSLKIERKRRGLTQAKLARVLGVSTKTVVRWERGRCIPFPYHREKLSILFGKTVEELSLFWETGEEEVVKEIYQAPF